MLESRGGTGQKQGDDGKGEPAKKGEGDKECTGGVKENEGQDDILDSTTTDSDQDQDKPERVAPDENSKDTNAVKRKSNVPESPSRKTRPRRVKVSAPNGV